MRSAMTATTKQQKKKSLLGGNNSLGMSVYVHFSASLFMGKKRSGAGGYNLMAFSSTKAPTGVKHDFRKSISNNSMR